jgi:hypothetical protein
MSKSKEALTEWALNFIKSKDAFTGNIKEILKNKDGFDIDIIYNDKEEFILVEPTIQDFDKLHKNLSNDKNIIIFLLNSFENFNIILNNWKKISCFDKLTLYFVNMFSHTDKKWAVKPKLHSLITDDKTLKSGLNSMFMMVEPTTEKEFEGKVYKE